MRAARTVVARQANKQKTNKISSLQPSPKERECSNGKVGRTKDEQKTNKRRTKDEQKTNKRRTKNEQRTNKERTKNEQRTNKERTKDGASRTGRWRKNEQMTVRTARADNE